MQQISIFLENREGTLYQTMEVLGQAGVRIMAATVADTSEYGILRVIVSSPEKAMEVLRQNNISANLNEVLAIGCQSLAEAFTEKFKTFSKASLQIQYMYCFSVGEKAFLIIRTSDMDAAKKIINENNFETVTNETLLKS